MKEVYIHKLHWIPFGQIYSGSRRFHICEDNIEYGVGTMVQFAEYNKEFTGRHIEAEITHIHQAEQFGQEGLQKEFCAFGFMVWEKHDSGFKNEEKI